MTNQKRLSMYVRSWLYVIVMIIVVFGIGVLLTACSRSNESRLVGTFFDGHSGVLGGTFLEFRSDGIVVIRGVAVSRTERWQIVDGNQLTITGPSSWNHPGTWTIEFTDNNTLIMRGRNSNRLLIRER